MSLDMSGKCQLAPVRIPSLFEHNVSKAVGRTQIEGSCKTNWKTNCKLKLPLQARSEEQLKHSCRWLYIRETFLLLAKHVTLSQKMRVALLFSIPLALLTSSEVLSCAHRADMSLDMSEKCELVPARIPSLFEHNVLKAVGRTQIEGSCKVSAGKTNWIKSRKLYPCKQEVRSTWSTLADDSYSRNFFTSCKACDTVAEDAFSVASHHSIGLIDIK